MKRNLRRLVAFPLILGCTFATVGFPSRAQSGPVTTGRLSGHVSGSSEPSGRGFDVLLLDADWDLVARAAAGADGAYEFESVKPGKYRLGISDREGRLAPVAGPPTEIAPGQTAVVPIQVTESEAGTRLAPGAYSPTANSWWDRQTRNQKIFWWSAFVVGAGAVVWGVSQLLEDDDEAPASPSYP